MPLSFSCISHSSFYPIDSLDRRKASSHSSSPRLHHQAVELDILCKGKEALVLPRSLRTRVSCIQNIAASPLRIFFGGRREVELLDRRTIGSPSISE